MTAAKNSLKWHGGLTITRPNSFARLEVLEPSRWFKIKAAIYVAVYAFALVAGMAILAMISPQSLGIAIVSFVVTLIAGTRR